jgi:hypothetical protein
MGEDVGCGDGCCGVRCFCFLRGGLLGGVRGELSVSLGGGVGRPLVRFVLRCFRRPLRLVGGAGESSEVEAEMGSEEEFGQGLAAIGWASATCARGSAFAIGKS